VPVAHILGCDLVQRTVTERGQDVVIQQGLVVGAGARLDGAPGHVPAGQPGNGVGVKGDLLRSPGLAACNLAALVRRPGLRVGPAGEGLARRDARPGGGAVANGVAPGFLLGDLGEAPLSTCHDVSFVAANSAANKTVRECTKLHVSVLLGYAIVPARSQFWQANRDSRVMASSYFNPSIAH